MARLKRNLSIAEGARGRNNCLTFESISCFFDQMPTSLAILFGGIVALVAMFYHNAISSRRSALDFISQYELHDSEWADTVRTVKWLLRNGSWTSLTAPSKPLSSDEFKLLSLIFEWLNHKELVAIGIRQRALNKRMYRLWMREKYVRDWHEAEHLVDDLRNVMRDRTLYIEFEKRAKRWSLPLPLRSMF